ncbi:hypothetical protein F4801DRAFT_593436 [Xylaria longipes]|nr:hypothetical protein F4801DRAFT_593436 [Xylaria longipes]
MVSMQFHLLGLLSLAATVARSDSVTFQNNLPANTIMDEGTTFVVKWAWDGDATGVGQLAMSSFKKGDTSSIMTYNKLNLTDGRYPWVVTAPQGRDTLDWYCSLAITYDNGLQSTSGRSFRINANASPSTTTGATSTSTSSPTSTTGRQTSGKGSSSKKKRLSAGTLAGIIVGVVAGVVVIAILAGLVVYYRRKARREMKDVTTTTTTPDGAGADTKSPDGNAAEAQYLKPEPDQRHREDSNAVRSELSGDS